MSDLELAQKWLGCWSPDGRCLEHDGPAQQGERPCSEATRLAALLAETRADEATNIADALSRCGGMSIKTAGALIRDRASRHHRASKP